MSPACGCQQRVRLERLPSEAGADSWPHSGLAEILSIADVTPPEDDPLPTRHPAAHADSLIDPGHKNHHHQLAPTGRPPRRFIQELPSWPSPLERPLIKSLMASAHCSLPRSSSN